jgi:hypothetical protein
MLGLALHAFRQPGQAPMLVTITLSSTDPTAGVPFEARGLSIGFDSEPVMSAEGQIVLQKAQNAVRLNFR